MTSRRLIGLVLIILVMLHGTTAIAQGGRIITPVDRPMWAVKRANLRSGAGTQYGKVGLLEIGQRIRVTGETGDWLRVQLQGGGTAFVYAPLLSSSAPPGGEGREVITYNNARYQGEVRGGREHGRGTMTWDDGSRYEGDWRDGKRHGQGILTWKGEGEYAGREGRYEGGWRDDRHHGHGVKVWPDGGRYVGQWQGGEHHGQGTKRWPEGARYQGQWQAGKVHGRGTYTWPDGGRYEGDFVDGKMHGRGKYVSADGKVAEGEWAGGQLARRSAPPSRRQRSAAAGREAAPQAGREYWGAYVEVDRLVIRGGRIQKSGDVVWSIVWNAGTPQQALEAVLESCTERFGQYCDSGWLHSEEPRSSDNYVHYRMDLELFSTAAHRLPDKYPDHPVVKAHFAGYGDLLVTPLRCVAVGDESSRSPARGDYVSRYGNTETEAVQSGINYTTPVLRERPLLTVQCNAQ